MHTAEELKERLAEVPGTTLVGIGDNVLDTYLHEDLSYPGGNALNVAVYSRLMFGSDAGFIGIVGDDRFAEHLLTTLDEIGVDRQRVRRARGANGMAFVALDDDGDRRFVSSNYGGVQHVLRLRITPQDVEYLERFTQVHTSVYSSIEPELALLTERGIKVSYDFSDDAPRGLLEEVAQHVDVGFFSGGSLSESEVEDLGRHANDLGVDLAVVTLGSRGAYGFERGAQHSVGIIQVESVDALGAGDAFITGFLVGRAAGNDLGVCLETAAMAGALACTYRGAFGYAVSAGPDARAQMLR